MRSRTLLVAVLVAVAACGREGGEPGPSPSDTPRRTATPSVTPEPTAEPTESPTATPEETPEAAPAATERPAAASGCRNSTRVSCGAFRFDPAPESDDAIEVEVNFTPKSPKVGDQVTFMVTASDEDSKLVFAGSYRFGKGEPSSVARNQPAQCPRAYGPWDPPAADEGSGRQTLRHTYNESGTYEAVFTFYSQSFDGDDHDWPDRPPGDEDGRCIDPYSSSGEDEVTVRVRE